MQLGNSIKVDEIVLYDVEEFNYEKRAWNARHNINTDKPETVRQTIAAATGIGKPQDDNPYLVIDTN
jgi:hypothetical protein